MLLHSARMTSGVPQIPKYLKGTRPVVTKGSRHPPGPAPYLALLTGGGRGRAQVEVEAQFEPQVEAQGAEPDRIDPGPR